MAVTNQQAQLRLAASRLRQRYLEPQEIQSSSGLVYYVLEPGEGTSEDAFLRFVFALEEFETAINNPPSGFFTLTGADCFSVNTASAQGSVVSQGQYALWNCEEYFARVNQLAAELLDASNDIKAEQRAYLETQDVAAEVFDDGGEETEDILDAGIDQQQNIFEQRDEVIDALTEKPSVPWWLYLAGAGLLVLAVKK